MFLRTLIVLVAATGSLYGLTGAAPASLSKPSFLTIMQELAEFVPRNKRDVRIDDLPYPVDEDTEEDHSLRMRGLRVTSSVTARFAKTVVTSHVFNPAVIGQEVTFYIELPKEAFISGFLIETEGRVYNSRVDEKAKAQAAYDQAKQQGQTAGQVRQTSEDKNDFTVSINIAAGATLSFNMTYEELLKRYNGYFENSISISPRQIVKHLIVDVYINEPQGIDEGKIDFFVEKSEVSKEIVRPLWAEMKQLRHDKAHVEFHPTSEDQELISPDGIVGKFVVRYDVIHGQNAGKIEIVNGYFVHHFSPSGLAPIRKNVVFVLDTSGSMSGTKIAQTKEAMAVILSDLREQDRFGIITFASRTEVWRERMLPANKDNIEAAQTKIGSLRANGGTDLHGGIAAGIDMLENFERNELSTEGSFSLIIMLTDGQPTSGRITNTQAITTDIKERMEGRFSLFCLGFGRGVDYTFLEKLSLQNQGLARKIYEDADAGLQLVGFFDEVATPLLTDIEIKYEGNAIKTNSISQTVFPTYFEGTELVVAGKLAFNDTDRDPRIIVCTILAKSREREILLVLEAVITDESEAMLSSHAVDDFAQRLWAFLTIKELLRKRTAADGDDEKAILTERALELSLKYHFVTPLTSLVVVKPDEEPVIGGDVIVQESASDLLGSNFMSVPSLPVAGLGPSLGHHVVSHMSVPSRPVAGLDPSLGRHYLMMYPRIPSRGIPIAVTVSHKTSKITPAPRTTTQVIRTTTPVTHTTTQVITTTTPEARTTTTESTTVSTTVHQSNTEVKYANPHFLIHDEGNNVTVCFDVQAVPGDQLELLNDPVLGLVVHGQVASAFNHPTGINPIPLVFDQLPMTLAGRTIIVSTEKITIGDSTSVYWDNYSSFQLHGGQLLTVSDGNRLTIQHTKGVSLVVTKHIGRHQEDASDYLGFDIVNDVGLSDSVAGLIGSYVRQEIHLEHSSVTADQDGVKSYIRVGGHQQVKVTRSQKKDIREDLAERCWYSPNAFH